MRTVRNSHNPLCGMLATLILMSALSGLAAAQTSDTSKAAGVTASQAPPAATSTLSPKDLRKAQIAADTERLYQMAQELKAEVAKSNKDILSIAVVKKADEIEKLAKSLKERMRSD